MSFQVPIQASGMTFLPQGGTMVFSAAAAAPAWQNQKSITLAASKYLVAANNSLYAFDKADAFSVSGWFRFTALGWISIFGKGDGYATNGWRIAVHPAGYLPSIYVTGDGAAKNIISRSTTGVTTNTWYHIVFTKAANSSQLSGMGLYVNTNSGTTVVFDNTTITSFNEPTKAFDIGQTLGWGPIIGVADEVTVWNKALSAAEVTALYNSGTPTDPTTHSAAANLTSYYRNGDLDDTYALIKDRVGTVDLTGVNTVSGDISTTVAP